jgi:geranylgeranyl diphosphate synthase type II
MQTIQYYQEAFEAYLKHFKIAKEPSSLYTPVNYILDLGGKRLRPVLTLMTAEIFDCNYKKALDAALGIEVFHNFSLIHDDIMDAAPLRRGKETVHIKWDLNTGILSGDVMLILAYQLFEKYEPETFKKLVKLFSKTALEVCEGQQFDVDFEALEDVTIADYLKMIEFKTAVLIGAAMKMGAIVANASENDQNNIYEFGKNLGIAFQLQDDYLDVFGDSKKFGKQMGCDIIENKKTYLYLIAIEFSSQENKHELQNLFSITPNDASDKIETAKQIFRSTGAAEATRQAIKIYTDKAYHTLENMTIDTHKKEILRQLGEQLMNRDV